eukprot:Clim_evm14s172 gene=Clim_evmTU14s172
MPVPTGLRPSRRSPTGGGDEEPQQPQRSQVNMLRNLSIFTIFLLGLYMYSSSAQNVAVDRHAENVGSHSAATQDVYGDDFVMHETNDRYGGKQNLPTWIGTLRTHQENGYFDLENSELLETLLLGFKYHKSALQGDRSRWCGDVKSESLGQYANPDLSPGGRDFRPHVQKAVLKPGTTVYVWGDLHGDMQVMSDTLTYLLKQGVIDDQWYVRNDVALVFLGDILDRGANGSEVLYTALLLQLINPTQVFMTRGNHEDAPMNINWGLLDELKAKFRSRHEVERLFHMFVDTFDFLPVGLYLGWPAGGRRDTAAFLQFSHGVGELGFNTRDILEHPLKQCFGEIQTYDRLGFTVDVLDTKEPNYQSLVQQLDRVIKSNNSLARNLAGEFRPQSMTSPVTIGYSWDDFVTDPDIAIKEVTARGTGHGKELVDWMHRRNGSSGVVRGHQHNNAVGPVLSCLIERNGCCYMNTEFWNGVPAPVAITHISALPSSGFHASSLLRIERQDDHFNIAHVYRDHNDRSQTHLEEHTSREFPVMDLTMKPA